MPRLCSQGPFSGGSRAPRAMLEGPCWKVEVDKTTKAGLTAGASSAASSTAYAVDAGTLEILKEDEREDSVSQLLISTPSTDLDWWN